MAGQDVTAWWVPLLAFLPGSRVRIRLSGNLYGSWGASAVTQGMYDVVARRMDCCLGWLPCSFLPAGFAPEQQCFAVLSLVQLLLVWALPIVILSRRALSVWARISVSGALAAAAAHHV